MPPPASPWISRFCENTYTMSVDGQSGGDVQHVDRFAGIHANANEHPVDAVAREHVAVYERAGAAVVGRIEGSCRWPDWPLDQAVLEVVGIGAHRGVGVVVNVVVQDRRPRADRSIGS